jgi:hypothetical protein
LRRGPAAAAQQAARGLQRASLPTAGDRSDRKLAVDGEQGRVHPNLEVVMRPPSYEFKAARHRYMVSEPGEGLVLADVGRIV